MRSPWRVRVAKPRLKSALRSVSYRGSPLTLLGVRVELEGLA